MKTKSAPAAEMTRAYSTIQFRTVDESKRIIEGVASTITPDSYNDTVDPMGIEFSLPIPFLYQHNSRQPIGKVISAKKSKEGLTITAQISPDIAAAPFIAEAWALIKAGLVPGLSIGFISLEDSYDRERGGYNFIRVRLLEISAVTIPANEDATITSIKSADLRARALSGKKHSSVVTLDRSNSPGVPGQTPKKDTMKIREQITQFENKRAASDARMGEIMTKAGTEGRTLDEAEQQEYDGLEAEVKKIDEHLVRLKRQEEREVAAATRVNTQVANDPDAAAGSQHQRQQHGAAISVRANIAPGTAFVRYVGAMVQAKGNRYEALQIVKHRKQWMDQTPEVEMFIRTVIEAGDTTTSGWASQLVPSNQQLAGEFLGVLRPKTLLGRIQGLRPVPFNIAVPIQSGDGTYQWVGEDAPAPVGKLTLTNATLNWAKAAGIIAITRELAMLSSPSAEAIVRDSMIKGMQLYLDQQFVGTAAAVSNVSPAGILNGIASTGTSGTTAAALQTDLGTLINKLNTNNQNTDGLVLITSTNQLLSISLMLSSLGVPLYPNVSIVPLADGSNGRIAGIPVYASNAISAKIVALVPSDVLFADGDGVEIDVSDSATIEMNSAPLSGDQSPLTTSVVMKSFWQNGLIGLRVLRFINWKVARTSAVEYLTSTAYVS